MTVAISSDFLLAFSSVQKSHQKKVREFIELFRERPDAPGINYERVQSARDKNLYSVRIDQAYRAIVFHPSGSSVYVLSWVDHHDKAYQWAERKSLLVNPETGALQVISTEAVGGAEAEAAPAPAPRRPKGLFAGVKDKHLLRLGVPEPLLPRARAIETDGDLEDAEEELPSEAYEALFLLASGYALEQVFQEMEKSPEGERHDTGDVVSALLNEDSQRRFYVVDEAKELSEILNAPLEHWRVFLHPRQRKIVRLRVNGPVRVLGGAGTGKTVVAMHRAHFLATEVFHEPSDKILFTTFTRNLATDIAENLRKLCTVDELARIEVVNLDAWASSFLRSRGFRYRVLFEEDENEFWENALNVAPPELDYSPEFYRAEWEHVIQAQDIRSADDYLRATRAGRGTRISRQIKKNIWPVFQEYRAQLNEHGAKEYVDILRDARELIENKDIKLPYRSIVIDEAQDMSAEAFRLIRALVPEGPDDLFIVGDAHQRIYRHRVSLGQCGVNIRGRGKKLRVGYRTTDEIRRFAVALLEGRDIDDLDGGKDEQKGFMALTHGPPPEVRSFPNMEEELQFLKTYLKGLTDAGVGMETVCMVARTHRLVDNYQDFLKREGFDTYEIKKDSAEQTSRPGVRVATMHRVKGLEFDHMIVVSANENIIPLKQALEVGDDAVATRQAETRERALLYVALTRAKRSALVMGHGAMSAFLSAG